jgi:hypothetical protein
VALGRAGSGSGPVGVVPPARLAEPAANRSEALGLPPTPGTGAAIGVAGVAESA